MQFIDFKNYVVTTAKKQAQVVANIVKHSKQIIGMIFTSSKDNANWCYQNNVITVDVLEKICTRRNIT